MSAISSGLYEVPQDSFDDTVAETGAAVYRIDLKSVLPDLFVGTDRMPRLLARLWRTAADEVLDETAGEYTYRGGTLIEVSFRDLPTGAARSRITQIERRVAEQMRAQQPQADSAADAAPSPQQEYNIPRRPGDSVMKALVVQLESAIGKLSREGLPENPGDELVRLWAARAMHNMLHNRSRVPLLPEMLDLVAQAEVFYVPFFDRDTGVVGGSSCGIRSPVTEDKYNTGEAMRQDLAMLFSSAVQLYYLNSKGQEGAILLPLRATTLGDETLADLYRSFLPRLSPAVAANLMLEIHGLPAERFTPGFSQSLGVVASAVKSCFFHTSVLTRHDYLQQFPVLHACGFSLAEKGLKREAVAAQGRVYAQYYRHHGIKTYVKDVDTEDMLGYARETGFTYIFGAAAGPLQKNACPLQKTGIG